MTERWLPIEGYENVYSVSDQGRVFSHCTGRVLKGSRAGVGYRKVILRRAEGTDHRYVHALVLETFIGARPSRMEACHANGVRDDNRLANLRWDTRANNHADKRGHGTHPEGEKHPRRKLTADAVRAIRADEGTCRAIGDKYGVNPMQVSRIKNRQNWGHLS